MIEEREEIRHQAKLWLAAVATGDPGAVVALYAADAVLAPTLSNRIRTDHAGIRDYFGHFLAHRPQGRFVASHIRIGGELAVNSGIYEFHFGTDGTTLRARYTFVHQKLGDNWLIVAHHSSRMPEG